MKTQKDKILEYIKKYGAITSYEAFIDLGITQLATRIKELKELGYEFTYKWVTKENRDGIAVSFKKYMLAEEKLIQDNENHISM